MPKWEKWFSAAELNQDLSKNYSRKEIKNMNYFQSRYEQEVTIGFNASEDIAELYTADPVWMRKMDKLVEQNPEQFKAGRCEYYQGKVIAKRYSFPKRFITIRSKDKIVNMTEEQRQKAVERMKHIRENS